MSTERVDPETFDRDDAINHAFEFLVDDDLEDFAVVAKVYGQFKAISFTEADEPGGSITGPACQVPRNQLLGKLLADFAVIFGKPPGDVATVAEHVTTDHLGVDRATVRRLNREYGADDGERSP
jgi:hypothetical protein